MRNVSPIMKLRVEAASARIGRLLAELANLRVDAIMCERPAARERSNTLRCSKSRSTNLHHEGSSRAPS